MSMIKMLSGKRDICAAGVISSLLRPQGLERSETYLLAAYKTAAEHPHLASLLIGSMR
jgi:hypothetical protein